jgi:NitT/TauT family transport system permease protein
MKPNLKSLITPNQIIDMKAMQMVVWSEIIFFIALWMVSPFRFVPNPMKVYAAAVELLQYDNLGPSIMQSFQLNVEVIIVSTFLSLILAYANTLNIFKPMVRAFANLRYLSMVGLQIYFVQIFGGQIKLSVLVFSVSVFFVTGMADVISSIPREQYDLAKTLGFGEWRTVWEVVVLGQRDKAFDVLRQNAAIGWMMLTVAEGMDRSQGGIGVLLLDSNKHFDPPPIFAILIIILILSLGQDAFLGWLRHKTCPYADLARSHG